MSSGIEFADLDGLPLAEVRMAIRAGRYGGHTAGLAPGQLQCNLAILPENHANDFLEYCKRNPKPCPLAGVSEPGVPHITRLGETVDLRTDTPLYNIYRNGVLDRQSLDLNGLWQDDFVAFAIGCSFTFENALLRAGIPMRHISENVTVPMYRSSIETHSSARFGGGMVVSMRPVRRDDLDRVREICARYPLAHGAPVHVGDPAAIGIDSLDAPDWGESVLVNEDEESVFWACGVTPQVAIMNAKPDLCITHAPGAMLIADIDEFSPPIFDE